MNVDTAGDVPKIHKISNEPISAASERQIWCQVDDVRVGRARSDATGALPQRERNGALYQIVFYHKDSNIIHVETSKSRTGNDLLAALQRAVKFSLIMVPLRF